MSDLVPAPLLSLISKQGQTLPALLGSILPTVRVEQAKEWDIPKVVKVTPKVAAAVDALSLTVARDTPALTVLERRTLTEAEIDLLSDERIALDVLAKYVEARKEAMRSMIFNHFDVKVEEAVAVAAANADLPDEERLPLPPLDDKGEHYLMADVVPTSDGEKKWVRQLSEKAPTLTADALDEVAHTKAVGDAFTHDDYLACTRQVRVLDEEAMLIRMRTKPEIIAAARIAAERGKSTAALYHR